MRSRCSFAAALALAGFLILLDPGAPRAAVVVGEDTVGGGAALEAELLGANEIPGPGDPNLTGTADLSVSPRRGTLCFDIDLERVGDGDEDLDPVVAVHIHPGEAGDACQAPQECPAALDLDFARNGLLGCVRAGPHLLDSIAETPEQFYLHVHTGRFPAGAVRGQLEEK